MKDSVKRYRDYLVRSLCHLERLHDDLHLCVINLAMSGELKEADDHFDAGDTLTFKREDFEGLVDQNVQLLLSFEKTIENTFETIQNINAISEEEIHKKHGVINGESKEQDFNDLEDDELPF